MSDELQELVDRQQIHDVILRYCRGIDRMDRGLVQSCYHPDATDEHGSFSGGVGEFLDWCWGLLGRYDMTMHYIANCLIEVDGNRALVESYGTAVHQGDPSRPERNLRTGFRYIDTFECRDGEWRIWRRVATTEWVTHDDPEQTWPIGDNLRRGSRGQDDAIYQDWRAS